MMKKPSFMAVSGIRDQGAYRSTDPATSLDRSLRSGHRFGLEIAGEPLLPEQGGIMRAKVRQNDLEWHVGEGAAVHHIFHVLAAGIVERLEQGVRPRVERERLHAQPLAQTGVEGRGRLHPLAGKMQVAIRVPAK